MRIGEQMMHIIINGTDIMTNPMPYIMFFGWVLSIWYLFYARKAFKGDKSFIASGEPIMLCLAMTGLVGAMITLIITKGHIYFTP
jgi:hypothetical protein